MNYDLCSYLNSCLLHSLFSLATHDVNIWRFSVLNMYSIVLPISGILMGARFSYLKI